MPKPNAELEKLIKDGVVKYGNDPSLAIEHISTGFASFDQFLGNGMPLGKIIELYGPQSTGKTLIAQYLARAVQQTENGDILYVDLEDSYDEAWWAQTGVDTSKLFITKPVTGEQAIDIMVAMLAAGNIKLGMIIVDSIAAMSPAIEVDPNRSNEENAKPMGAQARVITQMFHKIKGTLQQTKVVWLLTNQMRASLGTGYDEISALPGGWANKHFTHILLRTRKEGWINNEDNKHIGYNIEIVNKKNKLAKTADGDSIILPYLYASQIEFLMAYLDEAESNKLIVRSGPYFKWGEQSWLGRPQMRDFFRSNDEAFEILKEQVNSIGQ